MRTEFLRISVLRVASGPRVKLPDCKSALNSPVIFSTDRSKVVVPVLVLLLFVLWFILRGELFQELPCVILSLCLSVLLTSRLYRFGKREVILLLCVCLFGLRMFVFVCFLFFLVSGKGCGLWVLHSLGFSLAFFTKLSKAEQGELLWSLAVRRPSSIFFERLLLWNPWINFLQTSCGTFL